MSLGRRAGTGVELHDHVVLLVGPGEGADLAAAQQHLQRGRDVAHRHAEVLGAVPVEADGELRLVDPEVAVHVEQPGDLRAPARAGCRCPWSAWRSPECWTTKFTGLPQPNAGGLVGEGEDARDAEVLPLDLADDLLRRPLPIRPVLQVGEDDPAAHPVADVHHAEVAVDLRDLRLDRPPLGAGSSSV